MVLALHSVQFCVALTVGGRGAARGARSQGALARRQVRSSTLFSRAISADRRSCACPDRSCEEILGRGVSRTDIVWSFLRAMGVFESFREGLRFDRLCVSALGNVQDDEVADARD